MESQGCCNVLNDCKILNWESPKCTGYLLGIFNLIVFTMWLSKMTLFTIGAYLFLFYIIIGIVMSQFMEKPEKDDNEYEHVSKDSIHNFLKQFYQLALGMDQCMKKVVSLSDFALTAKFYGGVYAFMTVSNCLGDCFTVWAVVNTLFLWRPVYKAKKDLIDNLCGQAKQCACLAWNKVDKLIPKYKD